MDILQHARQNFIDYEALKSSCIINVAGEPADITVIVPVCNRLHYFDVFCRYMHAAVRFTSLKISVIFVEHDQQPQYRNLIPAWANYLYIPANGNTFNKCLCHNMGALYGPKADYYLFHDTDIIVPEGFFELLYGNIKGVMPKTGTVIPGAVERNALQSFTNRRLLLSNEHLCAEIISGRHVPNFAFQNTGELFPAQEGAPGGSILVRRDILLEVGFYEDIFFTEYSIEDQFFNDKIRLIGSFSSCNSPAIELIHLWHSSSHQNTKPGDLDAYLSFQQLDHTSKLSYMMDRKRHFEKYFKI